MFFTQSLFCVQGATLFGGLAQKWILEMKQLTKN